MSSLSVHSARSPRWPEIPWTLWRETCEALKLYGQIIGKYRLAHTPWINHSWHATFHVTARGLTTSPIPDGAGVIEVMFDFLDHVVEAQASDGRRERFALGPMSVAEFHRRFVDLLDAVGGTGLFHGIPNEVVDPIPFVEDRAPRPYDAEAVARFFQALVLVDQVMKRFRTSYLGKVSPVHFFWGSFDLAVTRFSGRPAPLHPGGIPALPDEVTREAYSHEVSSAGFWPGGGGVDFPAFYAYAYPAPEGFAQAAVLPDEAEFHEGLGEFLLPYEAVRLSSEPEATLAAFLQSTYEAAARLGGWTRSELECLEGEPRRPRPV